MYMNRLNLFVYLSLAPGYISCYNYVIYVSEYLRIPSFLSQVELYMMHKHYTADYYKMADGV